MNKRVPPIGKADGTTFEILAERVKDVHNATSSIAKGAVNQLLTIRNWAIGCYIVEYEQERISNLSQEEIALFKI